MSLVYLRGEKAQSDVAQRWCGEVASVTAADTSHPVVHAVRPLALPIHTDGICSLGVACAPGQNRNLLDYVWTDVATDGTVYAVVGSDGPATGDSAAVGSTGLTGVVMRSTRPLLVGGR